MNKIIDDKEKGTKKRTTKLGERVTNNNVVDKNSFEGSMISPGYSKMSRRMVDYEYVSEIFNNCKEFSHSKLIYLSKGRHLNGHSSQKT